MQLIFKRKWFHHHFINTSLVFSLHLVIKQVNINQRMEGKTVILSVLIIGLVMAQIQVEAEKICCRNTRARNTFNSCTAQGIPVSFCVRIVDCIILPYNTCPPEFPADRLENSGKLKFLCAVL